MAQKIFKDTQLLMHTGLTQPQYIAEDDWDDALHQCWSTGQTMDPKDIWFYVPSQAQFFRSYRDKHAFLSVLETLFLPARWTEILNLLEQHDIHSLLNKFDIDAVRAKISLIEDAGDITTQEETDMLAALAGI
jgi:hypothetical protein